MRDQTAAAYSAASRAADDIVRAVVDGIIHGLERGYLDADDLSDAIAGAVDSALTYTADQYACAWGLPDAGEDPVAHSGAETWEAALCSRAYWNLSAAVEADDRLAAAVTVARDARLSEVA